MLITLLPTKLIREKLNIDISIPANALLSNILISALLISCSLFYGGGHASICLFKTLTGLPCPACGTTRGVMCLLSGDISSALLYNPCAVLLVLIIAAQIPIQVMTIRRRLTLDSMLKASKALTYVFIASLALTWIFRLAFPGVLNEL